MIKRRWQQPDSTWRVMDRCPAPDSGTDCYVFYRAGGERPTDIWTIRYVPVAGFWEAA